MLYFNMIDCYVLPYRGAISASSVATRLPVTGIGKTAR
jgi:hypothetical protein